MTHLQYLERLIEAVGPWWFAVIVLAIEYASIFAFGLFMDWVDTRCEGALDVENELGD